jgi:methyltransferase (TIGR00027 family)
MAEREASKTAIGVALMRAVHQLHDGLPRILDDPVVMRLLSPETQSRVKEGSTGHREPRSMSLRAHVLLRSRFAEERLREAVGRGVRQFVLLGAGLDTFAFRQPPWAAPLSIYEVDHPASQEVKRSRLASAGIAMPANLTFAPIDFEHDTLEAGLVRAGFDPKAPAFVSCLGVLVYLTGEAIADLFAFIARLPAGSECVFTFGGTRGPDEPGRPSLATMAAALGEPWQSSMEFEDVIAVLARAGLPEPTKPTAEQMSGYLGERTDGLMQPKRDRIASVVVETPLVNESS